MPPPSGETRQAVTRSRINATQYQQPVRRQTLAGLQQPATRQPIIRQTSTPQGVPSPADRIPAEWGRIARLESKKSAPIRTVIAAPAAAPATAPVTAPVTEDEITPAVEDAIAPAASLPDVVSEPALPPARAFSAPAKKDGSDRHPCLQQIWRTMAFCSTAKTHSFMPEGSGHALPEVPAEVESDATATETTPGVSGGIGASGRQASVTRSQRVKELFSDRSKQIRQCVACK